MVLTFWGAIFLHPFSTVSLFLTHFAPCHSKNAPISQPKIGISKTPTIRLQSFYRPSGFWKSAVWGQNCGASPKKLEMVPFLPIRAIFQCFLWGTVVWPDPKLHFSEPPRLIAEPWSYCSDFWKSSIGPRSGAVSAGFGGKTSPKLEGKFLHKKGLKKFSPKILIPFLDSKFDVDFNFAVNH